MATPVSFPGASPVKPGHCALTSPLKQSPCSPGLRRVSTLNTPSSTQSTGSVLSRPYSSNQQAPTPPSHAAALHPASLLPSSMRGLKVVCCALFGPQPSRSPPSPDARRPGQQAREKERSELVNEETVLFIFQLDLDTQLQRALNNEQYQQAQEVRTKRQRVDEAIAAMVSRKTDNVGGSSSSSGDSASGGAAAALSPADYAAEGLRLRTAMARAVEKEDYKEAAALRDMLSQLEGASRKAQALAAEVTGGEEFKPQLRLGQRVWHRQNGYRGVVVGWDAQCCESEDWQELNGIVAAAAAADQQRAKQPYYHILVDERDWDYDAYTPPVAYVAEELLWAPDMMAPEEEEGAAAAATGGAQDSMMARQEPPPEARRAMAAAQQQQGAAAEHSSSTAAGRQQRLGAVERGGGNSWVELFGSEPLQHPYMYILFLGQDARGDYVPCRQLRDKYNARRRDVYKPGQEPPPPAAGGADGSGRHGAHE